MLQNMPYPQLPHHQSLGNLSEGQVSDTVSESSDNATLLSLSHEDLAALGAGPIREDVRINRKKLESLILRERENQGEKHYMESLMDRTNTYIQWPSRMKIGAKTKKDLFIRVYGHNQDDVGDAKTQILADLGPQRDLRITLKMEISYTDHSHLIGCRGQTIRRVMEDTGCHIHFPDSNRMSKEHKSNQVTIAGSSMVAVEQARSRVRDLSPLIFQFSLPMMHCPYEMQMNPDAHHVFIENIQTSYNVQVTIHPPNKLQQTTVSVKGCEIDSAAIKEAVNKIVTYFAQGNMIKSVTVESTMEISAVQHSFVRAVNDSNVHAIMMNTGAKIIFPDLSDSNIQQIKRSRVYITGEINCVYNARQQLIGCLPLRMIFDLADDYQLDWESVRLIGAELNVNVKLINRNRSSTDRHCMSGLSSLPPPVPGRSRTIQLIAAERNTSNIYEARRRILGGLESLFNAMIPQAYHLRPTFNAGNSFQYGNRLGTGHLGLPPLMLPTSPNMLSPVLSPSFWPPTPFASPFCSPPIATCVVNNTGNMGHGDPPPGLGKINLSMQHNASYGYNSGVPSPVNSHPPDITINNMKHHLHLPLVDNYGQQGLSSTLNTPMSLGGTSTCSELSPMGLHPGISMMNSLINDFGPMDIKRKAPGCERSNTVPNLLVNLPSQQLDTSSSRPSSPSSVSNQNLGQEVAGAAGGSDSYNDKINNPTNEKKYLAVKAMYHSKVGPTPRLPTSEWSGCGFSKTYLNLFAQDKTGTRVGSGTETNANEDGLASTTSTWTNNSSLTSDSNDRNSPDQSNDANETTKPKTHPPLEHHQSNLLDFAATRPNPDNPPTDLASLFIQNGLEKYIDTFLSEEIDLDTFATLTEGDLRSLGVTSYPARKRMLVIITQLACPRPDQEWN